MADMKLEGKIDISLPTCSDGHEEVVIHILDHDASVEVVAVRVPLADFTRALMGRGRIDCTIETSNEQLSKVGTIEERKKEFVPGNWNEKETALAPFLKDGWQPSHRDFGNHHCHVTQGDVEGYMVGFHRNVPKASEGGE